MTYDDCVKRGKLKKSMIDKSIIQRTMKMAGEDIDTAKDSLKHENWAWAIVQAYSSMLNISRAILFRDGYIEKSHFCVVEYLRYHYYDELEDHIERLDLMRKERHQILYDSRDTINKNSAETRVRWVEEYYLEISSEKEEGEVTRPTNVI
jgi:uncharacterized protein (UPF0332 family)